MKLINKINQMLYFIPNKHPKVLLGRWAIDYNDPQYTEKINKKIDLSNEDHCGTCNYKFKNHIDVDKIIFFETI